MNEKEEDKDDYVTKVMGTHGKFQLRVVLIIQFIGVFAGWQLLVRESWLF